MSDVKVAREILSSYLTVAVANPVGKEHTEGDLRDATQLERKIALNRPSDSAIPLSVAKSWNTTPEYWVAGGEIVAANLTKPLTCVLFAHLCVYALKTKAPKFGVPIEIVQLKKGADNHYVLVAGRTSGAIGGELSGWNESAFVIDLWGACQSLGELVSQPPAIIVSDMKDYGRTTMATIPAWGV